MAVIFRKADPKEDIAVGDVMMISPENQLVTRAIRDRWGLNERLVIGVCTNSDNESSLPFVIDGGSAKEDNPTRPVVNGSNSSKSNLLLINGGSSILRPRKVITLETSGVHAVNIAHHVGLGDRLTISRHIGKAQSMETFGIDGFDTRSIGKAIKYTNDREQVLCLLNIE